MAKLPYFPLYTGDWKKDPNVMRCSLATRAVWLEFLMTMHDDDQRGELVGTIEQFAIIARCSTSEIATALEELKATGTAIVEEAGNDWTVTNRRMKRQCNAREKTRQRVENYRLRARQEPNNASVTPTVKSSQYQEELYISSSSSGESETTTTVSQNCVTQNCMTEAELNAFLADRQEKWPLIPVAGLWLKFMKAPGEHTVWRFDHWLAKQRPTRAFPNVIKMRPRVKLPDLPTMTPEERAALIDWWRQEEAGRGKAAEATA